MFLLFRSFRILAPSSILIYRHAGVKSFRSPLARRDSQRPPVALLTFYPYPFSWSPSPIEPPRCDHRVMFVCNINAPRIFSPGLPLVGAPLFFFSPGQAIKAFPVNLRVLTSIPSFPLFLPLRLLLDRSNDPPFLGGCWSSWSVRWPWAMTNRGRQPSPSPPFSFSAPFSRFRIGFFRYSFDLSSLPAGFFPFSSLVHFHDSTSQGLFPPPSTFIR